MMVGASSAFAIVATFASGILLARLLSVEDRGLVALVIYWAGFAAAFGNLSLPDAFVAREKDQAGEAAFRVPGLMAAVLLVALAAIAITLIVLAAMPDQFDGLPLEFAMVAIASFIVINHTNRALIAYERANLNFARLAVEQMLLPLLYAGALIGAALWDGLSVETVVVIFLVSRVPILIVRLWRFRRRLIGAVQPGELSGLLTGAARFHAVALARSVCDQADKVIVSLQWTAANVAYFAVGHSAVGAAYAVVSQALNVVALPIATKMSAAEVGDHFTKSLRVTMILLIAAVVPLIVVAPWLVPLIFGDKYTAAVVTTQILALALFPVPLIAQTDAVLRARDQAPAALRLHIITIAVLGVGWVVTGYDDIVSLGLCLAASRFIAWIITLLTLSGDLSDVRLRDCLIWRLSDFASIFGAIQRAVTSGLARG